MGKARRRKRKWEKSKKKKPILRKPIAPPTEVHKSKKDYDRKKEKKVPNLFLIQGGKYGEI